MPFAKKLKLDNNIDLYHGTPIIRPSPEHVVQAGLGGELEVVGLIDHATNIALGGTIDKAITESLSLFRAMAGIRGRRGDAIRVEAEAGGYDLVGDVPVRKKGAAGGPPWTVEERADGRKHFRVVANTEERAAELARHSLRAHNLAGAQPVDIEAYRVSEFTPPIPFNVQLGGPVDLRAVAKSCVNALAVCLSPATVLNGPFDRIREYVRYGISHYQELLAGAADPHPGYACWDSRLELFPALPKECQLGPLDHRLIIRGSGDIGVVYATFELFGHLPLSVLLTDTWNGADFCWGLITDPRPDGSGHWRGEIDLGARPAIGADVVMGHQTEFKKLEPAMSNLMAILVKMADDRGTNDLITHAIEEDFGPPDGRPITPEMVNRLAATLAEQTVWRMSRLNSKLKIEPPPDL